MASIEDHPLRYQLANELHARPFAALNAPCHAVFLAVKKPGDSWHRDRGVDRAHLLDLLDRFGAPHPPEGATYYYGTIGKHMLRWESHSEFVTYTVYTDGIADRPFDPASFDVFPRDWLEAAPGARLTSALIRVERMAARTADQIRDQLMDWFVPESLAAAWVLDHAAVVAGDFRIDPAGHTRFAVFVKDGIGSRRVGRIVQRVTEIEVYKTAALIGLMRARRVQHKLNDLEQALQDQVASMTGDKSTPPEETLQGLLAISAQLEHETAQTSFRFGATTAYEKIVSQRIKVLRQDRFEARQTFTEFMLRRFDPSMRTVAATEKRLNGLAERATRAANLLQTRVDVDRSAQNQKLLESMDKRADLQLRLQQTVEGLSVVAISYYAVSLGGYLLYPLAEMLDVSKGIITAAITLPVLLIVWLMIRSIRKAMH